MSRFISDAFLPYYIWYDRGIGTGIGLPTYTKGERMTCGECDNWRTTGRIETCCGVRLGFCRPQGRDVEKEEDAKACKQFIKAKARTKGEDMSTDTYKTKILHLSHGNNGCLAIRASAVDTVATRESRRGCVVNGNNVTDEYDDVLRQLGWEEND